MQANEVLKLIDAGFTADEVRSMMKQEAPQETQEKAQDAPQEEPQKTDEAPQEAPQAAQDAPQVVTVEDVRKIVNAAIRAAQQTANAKTAERAAENKTLTAEDVLKSLMQKS